MVDSNPRVISTPGVSLELLTSADGECELTEMPLSVFSQRFKSVGGAVHAKVTINSNHTCLLLIVSFMSNVLEFVAYSKTEILKQPMLHFRLRFSLSVCFM